MADAFVEKLHASVGQNHVAAFQLIAAGLLQLGQCAASWGADAAGVTHYTVNIVNALLMFKESEVLPADATVWQVISQPAQYWKEINMKKLTMKLKGFIVAEGINLSINMDYPLYD